MMTVKSTNYFLILFSFLIGLILTIMPLPHWAIWLRPQWMLSILLFWVIAVFGDSGIIAAFFTGLLMDLVTGMPLGEHALLYVTLIYVALKMRAAIAHFPRVQQACVIAFFVFFYVVLEGFLLHMMGRSTHVMLSSLSVITTAIMWPWLSILLDQFRPKALVI